MADEDVRRLQRAWESSPDDLEVAAALIAALLRAGERVPSEVMACRRHSSAGFSSDLALEVYSCDAQGKQEFIGSTEGQRPFPIQPSRFWCVRPRPIRVTPELATELQDKAIPGLSLAGGRLDAEQLQLLKGNQHLSYLSLASTSGVDDAGLEALSKLDSLEFLNLGGRKHYTPKGLAGLARLPRLDHLQVGHCGEQTDFSPLAEFGHVSSLDLSSIESVTGGVLPHLAPLTDLRSLNLSGCIKLTGKAFRSFPPLPNLRELNLRDTRVTSPGLCALAPLSGLKTLRLPTSSTYSVKALRHVASLSGLRRLAIPVNEKAKDSLAELGRLQELETWGCLGPGWREVFQSNPDISSLSLSHSGREALLALSALPRLQTLCVRDNYARQLAPADWEPLGQLQALRSLSLSGADVEVLGFLGPLGASGSLGTLSLLFNGYDNELGDREGELLRRHKALRKLNLGYCRLDSKFFSSLAACGIEELHTGAPSDLPSVNALARWPALRSLSLTTGELDPLVFAALSGIQGLQELQVRAHDLELVDLDVLSDFQNLQRLSVQIYGAAFPEGRRRKLRKLLPGCTVEFVTF